MGKLTDAKNKLLSGVEIPEYFLDYSEDEIIFLLEGESGLEGKAIQYFSTDLKGRILKEAANKRAYFDAGMCEAAEVEREEREQMRGDTVLDESEGVRLIFDFQNN